LFGLPGIYYWSEPQFREDMSRIFYRNWLFAAHESEIPRPGDYITLTIGRDSLIIVRDGSGEVRGHFNSCRHRGSLICRQAKGHVQKLVCSYHQWVYGLDGRLEQCRLMQEECNKQEYPLHSFHVEVVCGFIFINLAPAPPSFEPARKTFTRFFTPHCSTPVKPCFDIDFTVKANWKTVFDNNRECYHCASSHREFCLSNFDFGMPGDPRSSSEFLAAHSAAQHTWQRLGLEPGPINFPNGEWFRCSRFPLKKGFVTESLNGEPVGPIIGDFSDYDIGSLRIVGLPNMWFHLNADYFMTTRLTPISAGETLARVIWYVRADAVEGKDYDPVRVADVWRITSEQDWELCEMNQQGLQSTRYEPGPLSSTAELGVAHFANWYLKQLGRSPDEALGHGDNGVRIIDQVDSLISSETGTF